VDAERQLQVNVWSLTASTYLSDRLYCSW
jgi:hypothetical protein